MTDRKKLVELMKAVKYPVFPNSYNTADFGTQHSDHVFEAVADHLIANGVTVQKRGRWIPVFLRGMDTTFACSECSREIEVCNDYFGRPTAHVAKKYPHCHCGAKMDLEG